MGEEYYATALTGVRGIVEVWNAEGVTADVRESGILWTSNILRNDYRTEKKENIPFWSDTVRYEWRS